MTTLDARGAWLIGQLVHALIRREEKSRKLRIDAVGGLTMGADPVALATGMVTSGNSTITAIEAVVKEGGKVAFAVVLVDRKEGGREKIEAMGYPLLALFQREELLADETPVPAKI